jgi:hypothetical protein
LAVNETNRKKTLWKNGIFKASFFTRNYKDKITLQFVIRGMKHSRFPFFQISDIISTNARAHQLLLVRPFALKIEKRRKSL